MKPFRGTIQELVNEIVALLRSYEESWDWVKKNQPEKGVQFHGWLRQEILTKSLHPLEEGVRAELKRVYNLSIQDDGEQGD